MTTPSYVPHVFEPIRTERLLLRVMTMDDVDDVHAYQSLPEVCRYLLYEPRTRERVAEKIAEWSTMGRLAHVGDDLELALELTSPSAGRHPAGRVIGHSYFKLTSTEDLSGEIGWSLHPDFEHQGYASEAARAMLTYAFTVLGLHRVTAELDPRNTASVALCKRLGMREEALFREHMWFKGEWGDTGVYAVLASEFSSP
ncbi:MAG: GNAT family N-acetyltransferase [Actinomycetota bacterium]|nr:GNAT family N-acetyltransferase [Actinomycetota bacterium]